MSTEDSDGFRRRPHDSPSVANSKLVPQTSSHVSGCSKSSTVTTECLPNARDETRRSPLNQEMVLIVCRLSGSPMRHRDFLKRQPLLSHSLGGKEPLSSTLPTSKDGLHIVI